MDTVACVNAALGRILASALGKPLTNMKEIEANILNDLEAHGKGGLLRPSKSSPGLALRNLLRRGHIPFAMQDNGFHWTIIPPACPSCSSPGVFRCSATVQVAFACSRAPLLLNEQGTITRAHALIDRKVRKDFVENGKVQWFEGTVTAWKKDTGYFHISYEDGDSEDVFYSSVLPVLIPNASDSCSRAPPQADPKTSAAPADSGNAPSRTTCARSFPCSAPPQAGSINPRTDGALRQPSRSSSLASPGSAPPQAGSINPRTDGALRQPSRSSSLASPGSAPTTPAPPAPPSHTTRAQRPSPFGPSVAGAGGQRKKNPTKRQNELRDVPVRKQSKLEHEIAKASFSGRCTSTRPAESLSAPAEELHEGAGVPAPAPAPTPVPAPVQAPAEELDEGAGVGKPTSEEPRENREQTQRQTSPQAEAARPAPHSLGSLVEAACCRVLHANASERARSDLAKAVLDIMSPQPEAPFTILELRQMEPQDWDEDILQKLEKSPIPGSRFRARAVVENLYKLVHAA
ncbi:hypothetical protein CYMTET_11310 [Cymbomonas tetramitiformis]|uniref:PTM/DIR17-like Tudor domain-containing protein n=1 Tax=Cymbomonas tetramitiformis TaxID=36881 RepID=A0AAE0GMK2_9CHLO|nr:hypothetical protein CYMTET_11310 [Cymbomonas tetramitiformis]